MLPHAFDTALCVPAARKASGSRATQNTPLVHRVSRRNLLALPHSWARLGLSERALWKPVGISTRKRRNHGRQKGVGRGDSSDLLVLNIIRTCARPTFKVVFCAGYAEVVDREAAENKSTTPPSTHNVQSRLASHGDHPRVSPQNTRHAWDVARGGSVLRRQAKPAKDRNRGDVWWCQRRPVWKVFVDEDATYTNDQLSGARLGQEVELNPVSLPPVPSLTPPHQPLAALHLANRKLSFISGPQEHQGCQRPTS